MTIKEWLTPGFFEINVILVTLMMMWTIFSVASNFLEDFFIPVKVQAANYFGATLMTLCYLVLIVFMEPIPTLYPNQYDWLLIGNGAALGSVVFGVLAGGGLAWALGDRARLRIGAAVSAVLCEALIVAGVLLWIISQE